MKESFLFLGERYPFLIVPNQNFKFLFDGRSFKISDKIKKDWRIYFELFYKDRAKMIIHTRVDDIAGKLGIKYNKFRITSAKRS